MIATLLTAALLIQGINIEGQVRDAQTHVGIASAAIELMRDHLPIDKQYTDPDGRFRFEGLTPGNYSISAVHQEYDPGVQELGRAQTAGRIAVELTRSKPLKQHFDPVLSARPYMIPENARKEFERAQKEIKRQNWTRAVKHLESGLRIYGDDVSALNSLGNSYRQLGQLGNAEAAFRRATMRSDSVYIALNLADVLNAQGRFTDAESFLSGTIRKLPENGDAYYGLAATYFAAGRLEPAEAAALQAERYTHRIADVHLLLAKIYLSKQNEDKTAEELRLYVEEAPNSPARKRIEAAIRRGGL